MMRQGKARAKIIFHGKVRLGVAIPAEARQGKARKFNSSRIL